MFARRLLLAALIGPAFTLTAQQPAGKPFDIASVDPSGITRRDRLRPGVWLGVLDEEDGITNGIGVPVGHVSLHLMQIGGTWVAYAGSGGAIHRARSAIERPSGPVDQLPTFSRGTGCWWLWLIFTGVRICR